MLLQPSFFLCSPCANYALTSPSHYNHNLLWFCCKESKSVTERSRYSVKEAPGLAVAFLALLGSHYEDTPRHEGDLPAPTLRALRFHPFMLGDGLGTLEPLSAFLATVLVNRHDFLGCVAANQSRPRHQYTAFGGSMSLSISADALTLEVTRPTPSSPSAVVPEIAIATLIVRAWAR